MSDKDHEIAARDKIRRNRGRKELRNVDNKKQN